MSDAQLEFGEPLAHDAALRRFDTIRQSLFGCVEHFVSFPSGRRARNMFALTNAMLEAHVNYLEVLGLDSSELERNIWLLAGERKTESEIRHHFFAGLIGEERVTPAIEAPQQDYAKALYVSIQDLVKNGSVEDETTSLNAMAGALHDEMADEYKNDIHAVAEARYTTPFGKLFMLGPRAREHAPQLALEAAKLALGAGVGALVGSRFRR